MSKPKNMKSKNSSAALLSAVLFGAPEPSFGEAAVAPKAPANKKSPFPDSGPDPVVVDLTKKGKAAKAPKAPKAAKAPKAEKPAPEPQSETSPKLPKLKFVKSKVKLEDLVFSNKVQAREKLNSEAVADYTDRAKVALEKGADSPFPALKAVRRNGEILVFSGFTRGKALKNAGYTETDVEIADNDAITDGALFELAIAANQEHGARLTTADKLHNLQRVVKFPEYANLSDNALQHVVGASTWFIAKHRPVASAGSKRVSKKGHTINTSNIGKGKGKAAKAAENLAENNEFDADLPATGAAAPKAKATDDLVARAQSRIQNVLNGHNGFKGKEIEAALANGTLALSGSDLKQWADQSESRIKRIAPLIINGGFKPSKAIKLLDQPIETGTKVDHLINSSLAFGGVTKFQDGSLGEPVTDSEPYRVLVWDSSKFTVTVTEIK